MWFDTEGFCSFVNDFFNPTEMIRSNWKDSDNLLGFLVIMFLSIIVMGVSYVFSPLILLYGFLESWIK